MRLFGRWRSNSNNDSKISVSEFGSNRKKYPKPAVGPKHGLFDGIGGYDDVEMCIRRS